MLEEVDQSAPTQDFDVQYFMAHRSTMKKLLMSMSVLFLIYGTRILIGDLCGGDVQWRCLHGLLFLSSSVISILGGGVYHLLAPYRRLSRLINKEIFFFTLITILFELEVVRRVIADIRRSRSLNYMSPHVNMTIDYRHGIPWRWHCVDSDPLSTMQNFCTEYSCEDAGCISKLTTPETFTVYAVLGYLFPYAAGVSGRTCLLIALTQVLCLAAAGMVTGVGLRSWLSAVVLHLTLTISSVFVCGYKREAARREHARERDVEALTCKTSDLLATLIPKSLHQRLKGQETDTLIAAKMEFCIVLFVSLSPSATAFACSRALETFKLIDEIYTAFDSIVDGFGFFKYHHINDSYVICCPRTSHPFHVPDHLEQYKERCVREAVLIAKALIAEASRCKSLEGEALWAKVGIACGPLAGAIVGKTRRFYCLFGDAINTSARMCSHSQPGSILCTSEFHRLLTVSRSSDVNVIEREEIHVKGKGMMKTFLLIPSTCQRAQSNTRQIDAQSLSMRRFSQPYVKLLQSPKASVKMDPIMAWLDGEHLLSTVFSKYDICSSNIVFAERDVESKFQMSRYIISTQRLFFGSLSYMVMTLVVFYNTTQLTFFSIASPVARQLQTQVRMAQTIICTVFIALCLYGGRFALLALRMGRARVLGIQQAVTSLSKWQLSYLAAHALHHFVMLLCVRWTRATGLFVIFGPMFSWINLQQTDMPVAWHRRFLLFTFPVQLVITLLLWPEANKGIFLILFAVAYFSHRILKESQSTQRRQWCSLQRHKMEYRAVYRVLNDLFPQDVIREAADTGEVSSTYRKAVVLRLDLCDYTSIAARLEPLQVATLIHQIYSKLDEAVPERRIFKLDTIGDEYICAGWLEESQERLVCHKMMALAETMLSVVNVESCKAGQRISCRIGIAVGSCVAGTMGKQQPRFQAIGEAMYLAQSLQATAAVDSIACSPEFVRALLPCEGGRSWREGAGASLESLP